MLISRLRSFNARALDALARKSPGDRAVNIFELACPLRYDIFVRRDYFQFFAEHRSIYNKDFDKYLDMSKGTSYYNWFRDVACYRSRPRILENPDALQHAFATQIRRAAELYRSFQARGFDWSSPIILRTGRSILPSDGGKYIKRRLYAGDGCHRLSLLLLEGETELSPAHYRINARRIYRPLDNTSLLVKSLGLSLEDYCVYLSHYYADTLCGSSSVLLRQVKELDREKYEELRYVLSTDHHSLEETASSRTRIVIEEKN